MNNKEFVIALFHEGLLCDCKHDPVWDRIYDDNNSFVRYELAHRISCTGRLKAAITIEELEKNGEI